MKTRPIFSESLSRLIRESANKPNATKAIKLIGQMVERDRMYDQGSNYVYNNVGCVRRTRALRNAWHPDLFGNYFTYREKQGMISYMPKGREQLVNDDGRWKLEGRQAIKPAKFLRSLLHQRVARLFKDHEFALFDAHVKAAEDSLQLTFKEVPFGDAYDEDQFVNGIDSCMWGCDVGPFYELFGCKAIVAVDKHGVFHGRAVLWPKVHIVGITDTVPFLDRIYSAKPEVVDLFCDYAASQGWYRKLQQCRDSKRDIVAPNGESMDVSMSVNASRSTDGISFYPYLDTFAAGDDYTNYNDEEGYSYTYMNTDGTREGDHTGQVQDVNGDWIDEADAISVDGEYYHRDSDDIVMCHRSGEYILRSEAYYIEVGRHDSYYIHESFVTAP